MNPVGGGCSEPRLHHCTTAWATEQDSVSNKQKNKINNVMEILAEGVRVGAELSINWHEFIKLIPHAQNGCRGDRSFIEI